MPKYKFGDLVYNITEKRSPVTGDEELYIGLEHLDSGSLRVTHWGSKVALKGDKLKMREGDILFGRRNTYLRRVAIAPHDGLFSAHGMIFRAKTERIDSDYLPFFLASDCFMEEAIRISVGSLSPTVNWKELKELEFTVPDLETQHKNAQTLLAANDLKEKYEELLAITDDLVKSQFIELFGDPKENTLGWKMVKLKECLQRIDSGKSIVCESHPRSGDFPAILKLSAVTYGEFIPEENKQLPSKELYIPSLEVKTGDLLFSRKNTLEYVGMTVLVKETPVNLMLPDLIFRLVPNETITPLYLHQLINHPQFRSTISNLASGSAGSMPNISKQKLFDLEIPLPPLGMQKSLCPLIQQTDKSKFEIKKAIENTSALIKSLMQQDLST